MFVRNGVELIRDRRIEIVADRDETTHYCTGDVHSGKGIQHWFGVLLSDCLSVPLGMIHRGSTPIRTAYASAIISTFPKAILERID